ncbi:MAG: site-2 protease family protein [Candidatus Marinimicrobia bacterium]|nr:site-2 protease family protein [Candidatus Neomarinimicrobiota bacterium]MBT6870788.1 site-2 protease family protein [Candidatus Neomarinimicrobiota bacterium]
MLLQLFPDHLDVLIILIPVLMFALCFHEFSHAYIAYMLGDDTAQRQGRLTLNPLAHLDPIGSLMILIVGFGWAKPVPVNPLNLRDRHTGMMKVAFAGPASNLLLAFIGGGIVRVVNGFHIPVNETFSHVIYFFLYINIALAIFNLIPVAPLDGSQIFGSIIGRKNPELAWKLQANGPKILLGLILFGMITGYSIIGAIITPFIKFFLYVFAGI